jgi:hypothetical protein
MTLSAPGADSRHHSYYSPCFSSRDHTRPFDTMDPTRLSSLACDHGDGERVLRLPSRRGPERDA